MNVLIKTENLKLVESLEANGFTYMLENIDDKQLYVIAVTDTVLARMQGLFDAKDFLIENILRF